MCAVPDALTMLTLGVDVYPSVLELCINVDMSMLLRYLLHSLRSTAFLQILKTYTAMCVLVLTLGTHVDIQ